MSIAKEKIKKLVEVYGFSKNYPEKSHLKRWCEDFDFNYTQWNGYTRGTQKIGVKIVEQLMDIFPELNLNWLLKDEHNMFSEEKEGNELTLKESTVIYSKEITNLDLMNKLNQIEKEVKKNRIKISQPHQ